MKKKAGIFIFVFIIVCSLSFLGVLSGCNWFDGEKLATPELVFNKASNLIQWSQVDGAEQYKIQHNDSPVERVESSTTEFALTTKGAHTLKVTALAKSEKNDSDEASIEVFVLSAAESLSVAGGKIRADEPIRRYYDLSLASSENINNFNANLSIPIPDYTSGRTVEDIVAVAGGVNVLNSGDAHISNGGDAVVLYGQFLAQFSAGAVLPVTVKMSDGAVYEYVIKFVRDKTIPELVSHASYSVKVDKADGTNVFLDFSEAVELSGVSVNAELGAMEKDGSTYVSRSSDKKSFTVYKDFLTYLSTGRNVLALHWAYGDINVVLDVYDSKAEITNLASDYDLNGIGDDRGGVIRFTHDYRDATGTTPVYTVTIGNDTHVSNSSDRFSVKSVSPTVYEFRLKGLAGATKANVSATAGAFSVNSDVFLYERPSALDAYINKKVVYLGEELNMYATNEDEVIVAVQYALMNANYLTSHTFNLSSGTKSAPSITLAISKEGVFSKAVTGVEINDFNSPIINVTGDDGKTYQSTDARERLSAIVRKAYETYPEATKMNIYTSGTGNIVNENGQFLAFEVVLGFEMISGSDPRGEGEGYHSAPQYGKNPDYYAYASLMGGQSVTIPEEDPDKNFKIEDREKGVYVYSSDELVFTLEAGYKPLFNASDPNSMRVKDMYAEFLIVMNVIVDQKMNDFEKVSAIYDWIVTNVVYDYKTANDASGVNTQSSAYDKFYRARCFYLEGVIYDKLAVCNGMAKAIIVMCAIEDIECYKVSGTTSGGEAHAWNKVRLYGSWYLVDATHGANDKAGQYNHRFLLYSKSDEQILDFRKSGGATNYRADKDEQVVNGFYANDNDFNVYANRFFTVNGADGTVTVHDYVVDTETEASALVAYLGSLATKPAGIAILVKNGIDLETFSTAGLTLTEKIAVPSAPSSAHTSEPTAGHLFGADYKEIYFEIK